LQAYLVNTFKCISFAGGFDLKYPLESRSGKASPAVLFIARLILSFFFFNQLSLIPACLFTALAEVVQDRPAEYRL
jgi:hypothetical protein